MNIKEWRSNTKLLSKHANVMYVTRANSHVCKNTVW